MISSRALASTLAGFTLLEVLIALAIGGFGLTALAHLQRGLQAESGLARQLDEAARLGERRAEALRASLQGAACMPVPALAADPEPGSGSQTVAGAYASYTVRWTVTDANLSFRTAVISVGWTDRRGVAQLATLPTIVSETDPCAALALMVAPPQSPPPCL